MNKSFLNILFLLGLILTSCKYNGQPASKENEAKSNSVNLDNNTSIENKTVKAITFNIVEPFKEITDENSFVNGDVKLTQKTNNSFILTKKDLSISEIDLSDSEYEGPGFTIYSYKSKEDKKIEIILIEATADIGTDWYYAVILNGNDLIDKFYIKEPRTNSETTEIQKFISISLVENTFIFKFKKDKIAPYSKIPKDLKSDKDYLYLEIKK
ncbi:hypothetical protein ACL0VS_15525 [Chryseobacterium sp. PMSZPI]|uniref:hypothetical protein n=1 Tax=Chryseobacterium sp. PMSZPI TaxID=1033900 RepID=UPI0039A0DD6B